MHDKRLEERLDALAAPQCDTRPPDGLRAAVRSARHQRLASASLLASLLLATGILVVVAMRSVDRAPSIDRGVVTFSPPLVGPNAQSVIALRELDPPLVIIRIRIDQIRPVRLETQRNEGVSDATDRQHGCEQQGYHRMC